jgi:hypothetical protein
MDNFLEESVYNSITLNEFSPVDVGDKTFWVQDSGVDFDTYVINKISVIEGCKRESVLAFFRLSTDTIDDDWRIHSDNSIGGIKPDRALVLYLSSSPLSELHGTAFWKHKKHGYEMNASDKEYDRMLIEDANDLSVWELHSVVGYRPNRALMYPSNYFHSKFPNKGWESGRVIYVMFYR